MRFIILRKLLAYSYYKRYQNSNIDLRTLQTTSTNISTVKPTVEVMYLVVMLSIRYMRFRLSNQGDKVEAIKMLFIEPMFALLLLFKLMIIKIDRQIYRDAIHRPMQLLITHLNLFSGEE